jgi:hypothetical protein
VAPACAAAGPTSLGLPAAVAFDQIPQIGQGKSTCYTLRNLLVKVERANGDCRICEGLDARSASRRPARGPEAGAETIYREKISGARADRPQLAKLMASLKAGDVVLVTKLDRLGRSTRELLDLIERIGKVGAAFRSLGDPLWDTSSSQGRLLSTLLAAIAEF